MAAGPLQRLDGSRSTGPLQATTAIGLEWRHSYREPIQVQGERVLKGLDLPNMFTDWLRMTSFISRANPGSEWACVWGTSTERHRRTRRRTRNNGGTTKVQKMTVLDNWLGIDAGELHVHVVDGGEDVGGALDDALARLGHGHRRAARDQHRLVARAQRQVRHVLALHQNHLPKTKIRNPPLVSMATFFQVIEANFQVEAEIQRQIVPTTTTTTTTKKRKEMEMELRSNSIVPSKKKPKKQKKKLTIFFPIF